jgi:hypothetical protein
LTDQRTNRAALQAVKLEALVLSRWGRVDRRRETFPRGAALAGEDGRTIWVYVAEDPARGLGAALAWADRRGLGEAAGSELHLMVDEEAGVLARRAGQFTSPDISVWSIVGASLVPAEPAPAPAPAPAHPPQGPPPQDLVDLLLDTGVEVVVEGGVVRGEVNGLEVARIVHGETTAGVPLDRPLLEVGVGAADRELTAMVHGELTPREQLARVAAIVRDHRRPGTPRHPLNELVPERWLRAVLCRDPASIGLAELRAAEGARPRPNLRERGIAVAVGTAAGGGAPVVVVCSVGVDLDLVPAAADARLAADPDAELWLVVPERDDHPITRRLAGRLRSPARIVPVPGDWRS